MPTALKINLSAAERTTLNSIAADPNTKKTIAKRAKGLLILAEGKTAEQVSTILNASPNSVSKWHESFTSQGIDGILHTSGGFTAKQNDLPTVDDVKDQTTDICQSDVNLSNVHTTDFANILAQVSDLSEKVESPALRSILLFLISSLTCVLNFTSNGKITEHNPVLNSIQVLFDKIANVFNSALNQKDPNIVKDLADSIVRSVLEQKDQVTSENYSKDVLTSQGYMLKFILIDPTTGQQSVTVPMETVTIDQGLLDFSSPLSIASSFSSLNKKVNEVYRTFIKRVYNSVSKNEAAAQVHGDLHKLHMRKCISFGGYYNIYITEELNKQYNNTEYIWDPLLLFNIIDAIANMSYRKGTNLINNLLQLTEEEKINFRTIHHKCCKEGEEINDFLDNILLPILEQYGINPTDGSVIDASMIPNDITHPVLNPNTAETIKEKLYLAAKEYNEEKQDEDEKITDESCSKERILHPSEEISVSVDVILVKAQRQIRRKKGQKVVTKKDKKMIPSTVVSITTNRGSMQFVAHSTQRALLMALAFMLKEGLLCNKSLIFYTDGQASLNKMIETLFHFMPYEIRLDYYHLKKKCYEYMTMAIKGGKKHFERNKMLRSKLYARLFVNNVQGAIEYLDAIDQSFIKNHDYIEKLKEYIRKKEAYMYCYALHYVMHIKNSSNDVENANNRLIADRCKNNGTSWLEHGLNGMRNVRWLHSNLETSWYFKKEISLTLKPLTTELQRKNIWIDEHFNVA